jgi:hypothetical protein
MPALLSPRADKAQLDAACVHLARLSSSAVYGLDNSTARIAVWLAGAMNIIGTDTLQLSYRQVQRGFSLGLNEIPGTGSRPETIKAAFDWLHEHEWFEVTDGPTPNKPKSVRICL